MPVMEHDTPREMNRSDVDRVLLIETESFPQPWKRTFFEEALDSSITRAFVFEREGVVAAYIVLYAVADEAHVMNVAVDRRWRRQGLARVLMAFVIDRCNAAGVKDYFLEVRESNVPAISLYRSFGFKAVGRRKRYYSESNEDALVMQLAVGSAGAGPAVGKVEEKRAVSHG